MLEKALLWTAVENTKERIPADQQATLIVPVYFGVGTEFEIILSLAEL